MVSCLRKPPAATPGLPGSGDDSTLGGGDPVHFHGWTDASRCRFVPPNPHFGANRLGRAAWLATFSPTMATIESLRLVPEAPASRTLYVVPRTEPWSESEMGRRAHFGDSGAWEILFRSHAGWVMQACSRWPGSRSSAPDLEQEVFLVAADWRLWAGAGARRCARFERILRLAAAAQPMSQDAVDDTRVGDEGDDPHAGAAGADQGVGLEDLPDHARPRAPNLPGKLRIVPILPRMGERCGGRASSSRPAR